MRRIIILAPVFLGACALLAQTGLPPITIKVEIVTPHAAKRPGAAKDSVDLSNIVIWLTPLSPGGGAASASPPGHPAPQITQINKSFDPHVMVIQVETPVQFPNKDPFLHNVFSLFDGKRFDLGFYEAGSSKTVHFDRPGVSFLFCNIHPEMSAVVVAVDTPYFALSDSKGRVMISNVPDGRYEMTVWYERSPVEQLKVLDHPVVISPTARSLGTIQVTDNRDFKLTQENKYVQYDVPPATTAY